MLTSYSFESVITVTIFTPNKVCDVDLLVVGGFDGSQTYLERVDINDIHGLCDYVLITKVISERFYDIQTMVSENVEAIANDEFTGKFSLEVDYDEA